MFHRLLVEKDVPIPVRDGGTVSANVFRPADAGEFPAIITLGPYPKDVHFSQWNPAAWSRMTVRNEHMHWETVDPEWWVPQGYAVVRCDTRGTGKSPGRARMLSRAEAEDFYDCIEWVANQSWSTGKVAVMGVSYFAMNAWRVAALRPPHLAAVVPWEGAVDLYRDANRHGGIFSSGFMRAWGGHTRKYQTDGGAADPAPLPPEPLTDLLARNQPELGDIEVPLLSAGNWGGAGLHLRGNVEGFLGAGSEHKFLQIHVGDHVGPFYSLEGRLTLLRFLEQFLRGVDTGITREPPIRLAIRRDRERYAWRYENEWPLARTQWTEHWLDASGGALATGHPGGASTASFDAEPAAAQSSVRFATAPFEREVEVTGPLKLRLWVSTSRDDADLFAVVRNLRPDGTEVLYPGPQPQGGSSVAVAYGWLRVSHRKLDSARSTPWRPVHTHDELQKVRPGEPVSVEIEILPTSAVFEPGHRLVLEVGAKDDTHIQFQHDDPRDRRTGGTVTVHTGGAFDSHLLVPIVPER
jgi:predicted acyl esterase